MVKQKKWCPIKYNKNKEAKKVTKEIRPNPFDNYKKFTSPTASRVPKFIVEKKYFII